jgi:uncharacterized protein
MARILLLLIIGALVYLAFRGFFRAQVRDRAPPPATTAKGEDMVTCSRCGVNMPRSESQTVGGRVVCLNNPQCK